MQPGYLLHDRYRIASPLGKGGMGTVYLAEDGTLGKQVAVKENFCLGDDSANQFLQEAHLLAALHHSNLPRVTDYFIVESYQYLVMDFLPGDDLQTMLEREGRQPLLKILEWADQLGDALTYMHTRKPPVIHRDIKPANIKLRSDGSAALVDFGIAKAAETAQKTAAGAMGYTPGFAPPEQAGGGRTGPFSDQYALAATIYNLLTGVRPVDSVKRVLEGDELTSATKFNPEIPTHVSDALGKAMSIQPDDRFDTVLDFLHALHDPTYQWTGRKDRSTRPTIGKTSRPSWFIPALVIIGLLVFSILGVSAVAIFKLLPPVSAGSETQPASVKATTEIPLESSTKTPGQAGILSENPVRTETPLPVPTQSLLAGGKWLAYSSNKADGKTLQIWLMQVGLDDEGKATAISTRQLTTSPGDKTYASWSSDGKYILYSAQAVDGSLVNGLDIWRIPVDGGEPVDLTNRKGDDLFASWSPKGDLICFTNNGRDDGIRQLYTMDPTGGNQQLISTSYEESQGIWSPQMQVLFYVITASNNNYFFQRASKTDYKTPQPYDTNQVFGRLGQVTDPAFSPDGDFLAYTRTKGRDRRVGVVDFQSRGANSSLLTKTGQDYDPTWSADGKWIAFTSERDGLPQIYVMTSAGLVQTDVSPLTARESYPSWQP